MTTGLLIIDFQRGMFGAPHDGEAVLERAADLLNRARASGTSVFHVRHDGGQGDDLERGTPGWDIHPSVAPVAQEPVIDKDRCSAFHGTNLHEQLKAQGITRLVIAGMQTEYCIDTACRNANGLGYTIILASDAHTTFDMPELSAAQIISHHNRTLMLGGFVALKKAAEISFD
jgi:nicotinamidase-related amidase